MRPYRKTSIDAHESVKESKDSTYKLITEGLQKLRVGGTFEEISEACGLEPQQVWKRLSEMERGSKIYQVGTTRKTSKGRQAIVWQLVGLNVIGLKNTDKYSTQLQLL